MSLQLPALVHNGRSGDRGLGTSWGFQVVLLGEESVSTFGQSNVVVCVGGIRGAFFHRAGHQWTTLPARSSPQWLQGQPLRLPSANVPSTQRISKRQQWQS